MTDFRIFVDANVLFAGLHSPRGTCSRLLHRILETNATLVISVDVLAELGRNMIVKLPQALPALGSLLTEAGFEVIPRAPMPDVRIWTDRGFGTDAAIAAAALQADVSHFCTGDVAFLKKLRSWDPPFLSLTPAELLQLLTPNGQ